MVLKWFKWFYILFPRKFTFMGTLIRSITIIILLLLLFKSRFWRGKESKKSKIRRGKKRCKKRREHERTKAYTILKRHETSFVREGTHAKQTYILYFMVPTSGTSATASTSRLLLRVSEWMCLFVRTCRVRMYVVYRYNDIRNPRCQWKGRFKYQESKLESFYHLSDIVYIYIHIYISLRWF